MIQAPVENLAPKNSPSSNPLDSTKALGISRATSVSLRSPESITSTSELFAQLDLDLDSVPLENLVDYNAVYYFLMLEDEPPEDAENLEKVNRYLEAFHHLQNAQYWNRALKVLIATPDPRIEEELHNLLGIWGYSQQQAEIYRTLLHQVNAQCDTACLNGLGHFHDTMGEYDRALEYHEQHLYLAREMGERTSEWLALTGLGNACENLGEIEKARAHFEQGLQIAREIGDPNGEVVLLGSLGSAYCSLKNYPEARTHAEQCLKRAVERDLPLFEARAAIILGNICEALENAEEALEWYRHALEIARELGDRSCEGDALRGLGDACESLGDSVRALAWHQQGLEIAREIGERALEGSTLRGLGNACNVLGNFEQAIFYFEQRLALARASDDQRGMRDAWRGLSYAWDALGQFPEAIACEEERSALAIELGDAESEADARAYLGYAYLNVGDHLAALENLLAAASSHRKNGNSRGEATALYNLAELFGQLGQVEPALKFSQQGWALAQQSNELDLAQQFSELMAQLPN
jgi:tetratricopeptide (TPR) repeat protein